MKSKTLLGLAVASTFAWSAGALAYSGHEVMTPLSVNESGPVLVSHGQRFSHEPNSSFATSSAEHTIFGSPLSDSSDWSGSVEQVAMSDEGASHQVAMSEPMSFGDEQLALSESAEEYAQGGGSEFVALSPTQEELVAWVLETHPVDDTASVG